MNQVKDVASDSRPRPMDIPDQQWLSKLKEQLQKEPLFQAATEAYRQLTNEGCDLVVMHAYVGRVAGYNSGNLGARMFKRPSAPEITRRIRGITRQLTKLAKRVEGLRRIWGFYGRVVQADCFQVPEELEDIAHRLSRISVKGFADWNPQREALRDLLDHVRSATGRYHYAEISLLINAELTWRALKHKRPLPEFRHDVDSLKMMVQRWKKERRAKSARLPRAESDRAQEKAPRTHPLPSESPSPVVIPYWAG